jgi:hypothetical protein
MSSGPMIDWEGAATALGYDSVRAMFVELYVKRGMTILDLKRYFLVNELAIKAQMKRCGVELRRGSSPGPQWPPPRLPKAHEP